MTTIKRLAKLARPANDTDWGSERQITAENDFYIEVEKHLTPDQMQEFEAFSLKATADERITEALKLFAENREKEITEAVENLGY